MYTYLYYNLSLCVCGFLFLCSFGEGLLCLGCPRIPNAKVSNANLMPLMGVTGVEYVFTFLSVCHKPTRRTTKQQNHTNPATWLDLSCICMDLRATPAALRSHASCYPLLFSGLQHPDTCSPCLFWFKGSLAEFSSLQVGQYGCRCFGIAACKNQRGVKYVPCWFLPLVLSLILIFIYFQYMNMLYVYKSMIPARHTYTYIHVMRSRLRV